MKKIRLILTIAAAVLFYQSAHAVVYSTSQMIGLDTGNLGSAANTGTLENWNNSTGEVRVTNNIGSLILTNLNGAPYLVASAGDRAFTSTNIGLNVRQQFVPASTFTNDPSTNIYFSWLYRFRDANLVGVDTAEQPIVINRLTTGNSGTGTRQHFDLLARNVGGNVQIGLTKAPFLLTAVTNWATTNIASGQTVFIVVRAQLINAAETNIYGVSGTSNNITELWINPPRQFLGTNEANVPTNFTSAIVGTSASDGIEAVGTGPGRFVFGHGAYAELDEFRAASTWAEVTPPFGQCIPAGIAVSPVSRTISAEINATLEVFPSGTTAPVFQWQVSTNGGTSFNDISNANDFRYVTPPLALVQSGIKYRAIVNAPCNGSFATSAVATVTLTNPVVTPNGVVIQDDFPGNELDLGFGDRANLPIGPTNSVWFTGPEPFSTFLNNSDFPGFMTGITTNSASLWLGYFTETNSIVHLAVGKQIKITMPFRPNSFASHTNNSNVRWGLYDYFDGGVRVAGDSTQAGGSGGNGTGIRGYLLDLNFGTNFNDNTPLAIYARDFLPDASLMGSIGDFVSLGSGPTGGAFSNTVAFAATTNYTLVFTVGRPAVNTTYVTAAVTGGPLNMSFTAVDTNYVYHRFDSFAIRPPLRDTTADSISFDLFKVEVGDFALPTSTLSIQKFGATNVIVSWTNSVFRLQNTTNGVVTGPYTDVGGDGNRSPFTNDVGALPTYYRLVFP